MHLRKGNGLVLAVGTTGERVRDTLDHESAAQCWPARGGFVQPTRSSASPSIPSIASCNCAEPKSDCHFFYYECIFPLLLGRDVDHFPNRALCPYNVLEPCDRVAPTVEVCRSKRVPKSLLYLAKARAVALEVECHGFCVPGGPGHKVHMSANLDERNVGGYSVA